MAKVRNLDEEMVCKEYTEKTVGVESLALKYHVGKKKIRDILNRHGVEIKKKGAQSLNRKYIVPDWKIEKYPLVDGKEYVAIDRNNGYRTNDYMNNGGFLTTHIKKVYGIHIPTLYDRRLYYMETGNYWWEQWFDIILVDKKPTKKCPYCDWETEDLENKSGMFATHLKKEHGLSIAEHVEKHPEDISYFKKYARKRERTEKLKVDGNYVICPICGERFEKLTQAHIEKLHGIKWEDFKKENPDVKIMSDSALAEALEAQKMTNLVVSKNRFRSKYEIELEEFITSHGLECDANRQILEGKEIDILIPSKKIGIEFDGLKFHTEFFGRKPHKYHLDKTLTCNRNGYGLIHIFEDEYVNNKRLVYSKLSHVLGFDTGKPKVYPRKCIFRKIYKSVAEAFLNENHIQGFYASTVYYGCYFNEELVAVMAFKNGNIKSSDWELTRFATLDSYVYSGIGGKIFSIFVKEYSPERVVSFADRRWTLNKENNLYTKLGFVLEKESAPDYKYYNERVEKFTRVHKMRFMKDKLCKQYGFPKEMTELEMARELGYDRIWDCGLFKYVWKNK